MFHKIKYLLIIMTLFSTMATANYDKLAYDFNFNDLDGTNLSLSDYKNKVIFIDFYDLFYRKYC